MIMIIIMIFIMTDTSNEKYTNLLPGSVCEVFGEPSLETKNKNIDSN